LQAALQFLGIGRIVRELPAQRAFIVRALFTSLRADISRYRDAVGLAAPLQAGALEASAAGNPDVYVERTGSRRARQRDCALPIDQS
jgi:hypothetical protein